jgi:hypothetical protein
LLVREEFEETPVHAHALLDERESFTATEKKARLKESVRTAIVHPADRGARFDPALIEIIRKGDQDGAGGPPRVIAIQARRTPTDRDR